MRMLVAVAVALSITSVGFARAETVADRARSLVRAQLAATLQKDDDALRALFDPDAIIVGYSHDTPAKRADAYTLYHRLAGGSPHSRIRSAKVTSVVAGGDATMMWITAGLALTVSDQEPEEEHRVYKLSLRLTELAVRVGSTWKVTAAIFDNPGAPGEIGPNDKPDGFAGATTAGPISAMLAAPASTAAAFGRDPGVFVLGTERRERAIGTAAAKALLGGPSSNYRSRGRPARSAPRPSASPMRTSCGRRGRRSTGWSAW